MPNIMICIKIGSVKYRAILHFPNKETNYIIICKLYPERAPQTISISKMSSISGGIGDGSTDSSGNAVGGSGNSVAVGGSRNSVAVGGSGNSVAVGGSGDYSIGDVSGVVGIAGSHSVGIRKTKSNLGGSVSISFGISFSLGNNVPVVSKDSRVSKVVASVAGVRKLVVGGNNSGGNVGDNWSSVGDSGASGVGNSGTSSIGNSGNSGNSGSSSIGYSTVSNGSISGNNSVSIVNSGDNSSVGVAESDLSRGVSFSIGISFSLGNNVPVVSKKARVSKMVASIAGVRKLVVGGNNSGGNIGDNWSSVGDSGASGVGNSGMSGVGDGASYGSNSSSGDESRSMAVVNTSDDSSGGLSSSYLERSVSFGIRLCDNSGNSQAGKGKGSHSD